MKQQLWKNLLYLKEQSNMFEEQIYFCSFNASLPIEASEQSRQVGKNEVICNRLPPKISTDHIFIFLGEKNNFSDEILTVQKKGATIFFIKNKFEISIHSSGKFSEEALLFLKIYLPYCFLSKISQQYNRAISITHFAQSLDGKIATSSGDSKWIGNEENLDHAHRMRALCDAILIGKNTLLADQPKLTVRRVEGKNPRRVVVGNSDSDVSCLLDCCPNSVIIISKEKSNRNGQVDFVHLPPRECGHINCNNILEILYKKNIHSVYVEGGSVTTSNFLKDGAVDILQLHISPLLFGSGKPGIRLPEIESVRESIQFQHFDFQPIGNTMMFVGYL